MTTLFGTDGIRGKAGEYPITKEAARNLGKALATMLPAAKVIICRDTRASGAMLESGLAQGIAESGGTAVRIGILPTNAVSYLLQKHQCDAGVMISASHNPAEENGLKFFSKSGFKFSVAEESELERMFFSEKFSKGNGTISQLETAEEDYISYLAPSALLAGMRIAVDCGNGAASFIAKKLFEKLGAQPIIINNSPDGSNINNDCGALHPQLVQDAVKQNSCVAGIALDGDADRLVLVDEHGNVVDGDVLIGIITIQLKKQGTLQHNTIVVTHYMNSGLDASLKKQGIAVVKVSTGDKHVSAELKRHGYAFGAENSGHIIFFSHTKTADALLAAVQVLGMINSGLSLSEGSAAINLFPYVLNNVDVRQKKPLEELPKVADAIKNAKEKLGSEGRVFVRYSGSENKLRILVEGKEEKEIKELASSIATEVKEAIG